MAEIWQLSAVETVGLVRRGALSPVEVVRSLLGRIEALEPSLQAWTALDAEGALAAARGIERRISRREPLGPLAGLAVGLKDLYDVAGLPTTAGSPILADNRAEKDSAVAARLRSADVLLLGKTVTTPFAYADPSATRNPWNLEHTPGGSSSGSAAAVASRMVPAAMATQTAGSGLRPAAYCGIVAVKPSYGRVSRRGLLPLSWSMDTPVVHARSVEDAALVLAAIARHDAADPTTSLPPLEDLATARLDRPPRLGLVREMMEEAEPELRDHIYSAAARLGSAGASIEDARLPYGNPLMIGVHHAIQQSEAVLCHQSLFAEHADRYPPKLRAYLEVGQFLPATAYVHAQRVRRRIFDATSTLFDSFDALLLPTAQGAAPTLGSTGSYVMLAAFTMLGLPTATLPTGLNRAGLPLAVQLVGRYAADGQLVSVARWAGDVLGPLGEPPAAAYV